MSIDLMKAKDYIQAQNKKHLAAAEEYLKACKDYGAVINEHQRLLAIRIMTYKAQKKNLGIEMAVLIALADDEWEDRDYFQQIDSEVNRLEYLRRGLEQILKAYESEKISIQSLLKYEHHGTHYYQGE